MDSFVLLRKLSKKGFHNPGSVVLKLVRGVVRLLSSRPYLLEAAGARPLLPETHGRGGTWRSGCELCDRHVLSVSYPCCPHW